MKLDINLMTGRRFNGNHFIFIIIILSFTLIISIAFVLPIKYKNSLKTETDKTNQELASINKTYSEYLQLEKQLSSLSKQIEINDKIETRKRDFYKILEIVDDSISHQIELTHISITRNILTLQGFAPNDRIIANCILKLQENHLISTVNIKEIYLDQDRHSRNFHIECWTQLPVPFIEDVLLEEEEEIEDFN
ncbi:MAG: hypothetical protein GX160_03975 [Clostridiales bacterium]|nr:hypothetical protein [Clostridiales bacterium]